MHDAAAATKLPKEFHIFHERHVWKSPSLNKHCSPAEHSMIAASNPEQQPCIMRKAVRQSVYCRGGGQADPKETTANLWIAHYTVNLIQRFPRPSGVRMQNPEDIAASRRRSHVHLFRTAAFATSDKLIAEALRQVIGAVSARAIDDNNFRTTGSIAQVREKRAY